MNALDRMRDPNWLRERIRIVSGGCWEWIGTRKDNGYGTFGLKKQQFYAHRVAYEAAKGAIPVGMQIDHICMNRPCVNPEHLRLATRSENCSWSTRLIGKSTFRGVWPNSRSVRTGEPTTWCALIKHKRKRIYIGNFSTALEAARAYNAKAVELFGEFARLNEIPKGKDCCGQRIGHLHGCEFSHEWDSECFEE